MQKSMVTTALDLPTANIRMRLPALLLLLVCGSSIAGYIPDKERDQMISLVLKNFWGNAKDSAGRFIEPASESERSTPPVSKAAAYRAMDAGEFSGMGEWCRLDWQPHYFALTKAARAKGFTDKQVAFLSFLHGAAQERVSAAMKTAGSCTDANRSQVERALKQSASLGVGA